MDEVPSILYKGIFILLALLEEPQKGLAPCLSAPEWEEQWEKPLVLTEGVFSVESELIPQKTKQKQANKQMKTPKNRGPSHKSPMTDQKDFGETETCHHSFRKFEPKSLWWFQPHQLHSERYLWLPQLLPLRNPACDPPGADLGNSLC